MFSNYWEARMDHLVWTIWIFSSNLKDNNLGQDPNPNIIWFLDVYSATLARWYNSGRLFRIERFSGFSGCVFQNCTNAQTKKHFAFKARWSAEYELESHLRQLQSADPTFGKAAVYLINNTDYDRFINYADIGKVI